VLLDLKKREENNLGTSQVWELIDDFLNRGEAVSRRRTLGRFGTEEYLDRTNPKTVHVDPDYRFFRP
jgi:hypothetical protein